jgi:hypothetical protein
LYGDEDGGRLLDFSQKQGRSYRFVQFTRRKTLACSQGESWVALSATEQQFIGRLKRIRKSVATV